MRGYRRSVSCSKSLVTVKELSVMVHQLLNKPSFIDLALSNAPDRSLITLKLTRDRPVERNTVDKIEQHYDYARWLMGPNVVNDNKFSIDGLGINIHTRSNQGRSKKETEFTAECLVNADQIPGSALLFQIAKG